MTEFIRKSAGLLSKPFGGSDVKHLSDEELMLKVQANDQDAYKVLYNKYKRPIMSFVYNMIKKVDVTEDLVQTTFLKVYKSRGSYRNQYKFTTWLWTIARNTTYDYLRKKKEISIEDFRSEDGKEFDIEDKSMGIEEKLVLESDKNLILKCLEKMNPRQREALNLRIFSESNYEHIAEVLNISQSATKSLINRAKNSLIACVKDCLAKGERHE